MLCFEGSCAEAVAARATIKSQYCGSLGVSQYQGHNRLYQDEMVDFLCNYHFQVHITTSSVARALNSRGWTKKQFAM